jgi:branched-chain amino acid transport system substrate-binding protein
MGAATGLIHWYWIHSSPVKVAVGIDAPVLPGAAVDPSDRNAADLFLEENPRSRIRLINHHNPADPAAAAAAIQSLKRQGVRFFITTQASKHAVPSLPEFEHGQALAINVSAASNQLSGRDDHFLRVVPDVDQEQRAIAAQLNRLPGGRLLVVQDTDNLAYTDPAYAIFSRELARSGRWQVERQQLAVVRFNPGLDRRRLEGNYDALYILAGGFVPVIGNIAQLFHLLHPKAPILLTPWANSEAVLQNAGPSVQRIQIASFLPARRQDPGTDAYLKRFEQRFGYQPHAMSLSVHQALELLDRALAGGASTPAAVKHHLLNQGEHPTRFGPIRFDASGDVVGSYRFIRPSLPAAP